MDVDVGVRKWCDDDTMSTTGGLRVRGRRPGVSEVVMRR